MANPLVRKRGAHREAQPSRRGLPGLPACPILLKTPCDCKQPQGWCEANCASKCNCSPNPLDNEDFARMHLPLELWCASQEGLTPSVQDPITKFSARILEVKEKNVGLFLFGDVGSGKTGAACVVLKEARAWGFTAYAISVTELRDAARTYAAFDSESTIMDRARNVDFLLLDDLRKEDTDEKIFGINDIRNLIVGRHDRGLPTIITSLIGSNTWGETVPSIQAAAEKCCASQKVIGPNRHKITAKAKNDLLK